MTLILNKLRTVTKLHAAGEDKAGDRQISGLAPMEKQEKLIVGGRFIDCSAILVSFWLACGSFWVTIARTVILAF